MVRGGSLFGALLGAGGATAYFNGIDVTGSMGQFLSPSFGWRGAPGGMAQGRNGELDDLYKLVERLSRDVHRNQGVTIVHGSQGSSAIFTYGGIILVLSSGVMYLKGWKITDFLYVTRAGLNKSISSVTSSMDGLSQRMQGVKQFLQQQVEALKAKQDHTIRAQEALANQLDTVGADVENTRTDVAEVHADLTKLGENMSTLAEQQTYTSEGIFLLCSVVGELMKGVGHRASSVVELEKYLKRPLAGRVQGLEGLLGVDGEGQAGPLRLPPSGLQRMALAAASDTSEHAAPPPPAARSMSCQPAFQRQTSTPVGWFQRRPATLG